MPQFRIRDLLTLILIAGICLVWFIPTERGIPASKLLNAKKISDALITTLSPFDPLPPFTDQELVETLNLKEWIEVQNWNGSPVTPYRGMEIEIDTPWLDTPVSFYWELSEDSTGSIRVVWNADWDAIQKQNMMTYRTTLVRSVLTVIAVAFLALLYKPKRRREEQ